MIAIASAFRIERHIVSCEARADWREHGVGQRRAFAEQEGAAVVRSGNRARSCRRARYPACAPDQTRKCGKCALMFIGRAERRLLKPECISPETERLCVRAARSAGRMPALGKVSLRYSAIASVSHTCMPLWSSAGVRKDGDSSRSSARAPGSSIDWRFSSNFKSGHLAKKPTAQRPGRIILAADRQYRIGHLIRSPQSLFRSGHRMGP